MRNAFSSRDYSSPALPNVLVYNCGSSSVKCQVVEPVERRVVFACHASKLNTDDAVFKVDKGGEDRAKKNLGKVSYADVSKLISEHVKDIPFEAIGHRNGFNLHYNSMAMKLKL